MAASAYGYGSPLRDEDAPRGASFGLLPAVLLSLALHGLILGLGHAWRLPDQVPRVLFAFLRQWAPAGGEAPPEQKAAGAFSRPARPPIVAREAKGEAKGEGVAAGAPPGASRPPASAASAASSEGSAAEGSLDADGVRRYRLALGGGMRRHRLYPAEALRNGWQGRVDLLLTVYADARPCLVSVAAGSGHESLDRQARDMLLAAAREAPLPPPPAWPGFRPAALRDLRSRRPALIRL